MPCHPPLCAMCAVCVCVLGVCVSLHANTITCVYMPPPPLHPPSLALQSDTSKSCEIRSFLPSFVPSFLPSFICLPLFLRSFFFRSTIVPSLMSVLPSSFNIALSFLPSFRSSYLLQMIYGIDDLSPEGMFNSSLPPFLPFLPSLYSYSYLFFLPSLPYM